MSIFCGFLVQELPVLFIEVVRILEVPLIVDYIWLALSRSCWNESWLEDLKEDWGLCIDLLGSYIGSDCFDWNWPTDASLTSHPAEELFFNDCLSLLGGLFWFFFYWPGFGGSLLLGTLSVWTERKDTLWSIELSEN
jgi:hypothetical protein